MKSNARLKMISLLPVVWLAASSLLPFAAESESKASARLPDWVAGWRVTGVITQGIKTEASVEHRLGWKRFVRKGNKWSLDVVVERIDAEKRTVTLRRGEQTAVLRTGVGPEIAKAPTKAPFKTSFQVRLASGETVAFGGWASGPGKRTLALGTPVIDAQNGQVTFSMHFIDAPEAVWNRLGLGDVKNDGRQSSQSSTLAVGQLDSILNAAKNEVGVDVLSTPSVATRDGSPSRISIGQESDPAGMISVNTTRKLTSDRSAVDLSLDAQFPVP